MKTIHLVSHTHWDREWYRPFQYFRTRLVHVLDHVMEILEQDSRYRSFLLDGQSVPLEDYLQVKPEQYNRLQDLIRSERLVVGPWYVQPDEFAPDGESLIRNLQIGMEIAKKFGKSMMIGYLPDSFGQSGQMPHILAGFGIDYAVVMRGVPEDIETCEFTWEGINGDRVLAISLPNGYSNAMFLPEDNVKGKLRIRQAVLALKKWTTGDHILLMNGVDHQFPQAFLPDLIENLNRSSKKERYVHSTLEEYMHAVKESTENLPVQQGEMISPCKHRVHTSIASTRIYQKQKNRQMETMLEKYVEPVTSLAWLLGAEYPRGLIRQAWKILLQNQTHDGLCGCCSDEVHHEMDQRFTDIENIGTSLLKAYSRAICAHGNGEDLTLTVFNNAMTKSRQLVHATVYVTKEEFTLFDAQGSSIPYQVEKVEKVDVSTLSIWTLYLHGKDIHFRMNISFYVDFDANYGCRQFVIQTGKSTTPKEHPFRIENKQIDSPFYTLQVRQNGSMLLYDKMNDITLDNLLLFEDRGDAGDTYNYSPVKNDTIITSQGASARVDIIESGEIFTTVRIETTLNVPEKLVDDDEHRSQTTLPLNLVTLVRLYSQMRRIDFSTTIENNVLDHRVRVLFDAGVQSSVSFAETQFGTIRRPNHIPSKGWKSKGWKEKPLPIYSQQRFVDLHDGKRGLAVLNRGLPEYEIYDDHTIAITLLRGVGMMGKPDLLIRPGRPSGMAVAAPDAQCSGSHTLEYALFPHAGNFDDSLIAREAAEFDAPPLAVQNRIHSRRILHRENIIGKFIEIENLCTHIQQQLQPIASDDLGLFSINKQEIMVSALKKAECENALILRMYNAASQPVENVAVTFYTPLNGAYVSSFNETNDKALEIMDQNIIRIGKIDRYTAVTLKIYLAKEDHIDPQA